MTVMKGLRAHLLFWIRAFFIEDRNFTGRLECSISSCSIAAAGACQRRRTTYCPRSLTQTVRCARDRMRAAERIYSRPMSPEERSS